MRYAARRDANDAAITAAVRAAGFTVYDLGQAGQGVPDKLVTAPGFAAFLEIKTPTGKLRRGQERFQMAFEPLGMWYLARDPAETVAWLQARLTTHQKP
jgi:hypothetical protein